MKAYERLINYTKFPTASNENCPDCPSTKSQIVFAESLVEEMKAIGISNVTLDRNGYIFGTIPSNIEKTDAPVIGFIAHMDVVADVQYKNIKANVVKNYDGKALVLNKEQNIVMNPDEFSSMKNYIGKDLLVTDGTTLLGADDKAGIAEILTFAETLCNDSSIKHGTIKIGFTPDEEIGRGADLFDVQGFGADFAYTCDGAAFGEVEYETFNASTLKVSVKGKNIHPGSAKDKMINSILVGQEFLSLLPSMSRPDKTEGYQGFFHVTSFNGTIEETTFSCLIRDHDLALLKLKEEYAKRVGEELNKKYGVGTVDVEIKEGYYNMKEKILPHFHLIDTAYEAVREIGGNPISVPIRGGTDGCRLSFMGLPCPNLGTGSHNHHGKFEYACVQEMDKVVELLVKIAEKYAK
ncbi:MAG: peptidase T [Oscillospiraceae bacterium]